MRKKIPTFAEINAAFAKSRAEHDRDMQEIRKIQQETDRILKENAEQMKIADELLSEKIKAVTEQIGGISNNQGFHAEQFFQDVFKKKLEFGRIKYDEMIPNLTHNSKNGIEFDIALVNGDSIALIEVKNRIHPDFVKELAEERIEKFRRFFREFDGYNVYLGIAGFSFSEEVLHRASAYGIGIIKQAGDGVEISAENLRAY